MKNLEICWNITSSCNQNCAYCHRFCNIKHLTFEENKKILNNMIGAGITHLTWTGGEALLLDYLDELLKISHESNIRNKLITNGILLTESRLNNICEYLDMVNLSIDSCDSEINKILGRGGNHTENIARCLELLKKFDIQHNINTVLTNINKEEIYGLAEFLRQYNLGEWRIFKFMALRGKSLETDHIFDIKKEEYQTIIEDLKNKYPNYRITTREIKDFETLYILVLANGDVFITQNCKDIKIGNLLQDNLSTILNNI